MLLFIVFSKLNVALNSGKFTSLLLSYRVCAIHNGITSLNIQEVELNWIS